MGEMDDIAGTGTQQRVSKPMQKTISERDKPERGMPMKKFSHHNSGEMTIEVQIGEVGKLKHREKPADEIVENVLESNKYSVTTSFHR